MIYKSCFIPLLLLVVSGCTLSPVYIDDKKNAEENALNQFNSVHFTMADSFIRKQPECIATLPIIIEVGMDNDDNNIEATKEQLEKLHWNLYAHVSPYPYRDIELSDIKAFYQSHHDALSSYEELGKALNCDALLIPTLTQYKAEHFGLYSQASVGMKIKLIRASNAETLWEGNHIARSHAGGVPLSPVGVVEGVYSATENISDEQLVRVEDDLIRRLLATWEVDNPKNTDAYVATKENKTLTSYQYVVTAKRLFLRAGPGMSYEPKDILVEKDNLILVDSQYSPWLKVKDEQGQFGFVHKNYVSVSKLR